MPVVVSTNLENDAGNTEDRPCGRIELKGVNVLQVAKWENRPLRLQPQF